MKYKEKSEQLEQYDGWQEILDGKMGKYSPLIGEFIIQFSVLEHSLNLSLANILNRGSHETGYVIVEKLTLSNKIELFKKLYLRIISFNANKGKKKLDSIYKNLLEINTFRNMIAHANWSTIDSGGYVRTRIQIGSNDGSVSFKNLQITRKTIMDQIRQTRSLAYWLDEFSEKAREFWFTEKD